MKRTKRLSMLPCPTKTKQAAAISLLTDSAIPKHCLHRIAMCIINRAHASSISNRTTLTQRPNDSRTDPPCAKPLDPKHWAYLPCRGMVQAIVPTPARRSQKRKVESKKRKIQKENNQPCQSCLNQPKPHRPIRTWYIIVTRCCCHRYR